MQELDEPIVEGARLGERDVLANGGNPAFTNNAGPVKLRGGCDADHVTTVPDRIRGVNRSDRGPWIHGVEPDSVNRARTSDACHRPAALLRSAHQSRSICFAMVWSWRFDVPS